jgi:uncharacterized protein
MNKTALITGASSGIGAEFARRFASLEYDLILVARRENLLQSLCKELSEKYKINAEYMVIELSSPQELKKVEDKIKSTENLEILVNNAGFGLANDFLKMEIDEAIKMVEVHNIAAARLTHTAISVMRKLNKGTIINVSSSASFIITPSDPLYSATKVFLNTFSESLSIALRGTGVKIQSLCPGFTLTDFHERLGYDKNDPFFKKFYSSKFVVDCSLKDLKKNKVLSIPGFKYKLLQLVPMIPKKILYSLVAKGHRRFSKKSGE